MLAPGTTAPELSRTKPLIVPRFCAASGALRIRSANETKKPLLIRNFRWPPGRLEYTPDAPLGGQVKPGFFRLPLAASTATSSGRPGVGGNDSLRVLKSFDWKMGAVFGSRF